MPVQCSMQCSFSVRSQHALGWVYADAPSTPPPCLLQVMLCMFSLHYPKTMPGIATSAVLLMLSVSGAACCAYMARHVTLDALVVAEVIPPGPLGNRKPRTGIPGMV